MARGRKTYRVVSQGMGSEVDQAQLINMFQQMTGDPTKMDKDIVREKYMRLKNDICRCNKLALKFKEAILDRLATKRNVDPYFDHEVSALVDFVTRAEEYLDTVVTDDNINPVYLALKDSFIVEEYLKVCKALQRGQDCLKDRCALRDTFITLAPGGDLYIFDFAKINFKHLFSHILGENFPEPGELSDCKRYILVMCNMLYITTQDIYAIVTSPDVDIDKLSALIVQAIAAAKKNIPRCDKAFRLIENSVDVLKNGMSGYYKDFVATGNPAVIFENFIMDISNDMHLDTTTLTQFKRIIFHFRKQAQSAPQKHKQMNGMLNTLDKLMSIMDPSSENDASGASSSTESDSEEIADVKEVKENVNAKENVETTQNDNTGNDTKKKSQKKKSPKKHGEKHAPIA